MKTLSLPLLQLARALGLVRGTRMVRVRIDHGVAWAVALRIIGHWWLAAPPQQGRFAVQRGAAGAMSRPLVLVSIGDARKLLDDMGL